MKQRYAWINGQFIPEHEATLPVTDLALQRGYGIFDFLKTMSGKPVFLTDHLERFARSADRMGLTVAAHLPPLTEVVGQLLKKNDLQESGIKMLLTGGPSADGYTVEQPSLIITQSPLHIDQAVPARPMYLKTFAHQRQLPGVKTIDYLQAILLQPWLRKDHADDVLYLDGGWVRECPRANIFLVKDQQVFTPKTNVLEGVTRKKILQMTGGNLQIAEKDLRIEDWLQADEIFICSSTKLIYPVGRIDDTVINNGQPGPVTLGLRERLIDLIRQDVATN